MSQTRNDQTPCQITVRQIARDYLPKSVKKAVKRGLRRYASATWTRRVLPDFLIIGAQKSGTSSLFYYLQQHPHVILPTVITKEVHFFDCHYGLGENWYRGHFPLRSRLDTSQVAITGEATPEYLFHPCAPLRAHQTVPKAKLVALLRNPIERAFSAYKMECKRNNETLSFAEALDAENERLAGEEARLMAEADYTSFTYTYNSYRRRGEYIDQLEKWAQHFPKENILVIQSEEFFQRTAETFDRVLGFLGLPAWHPPQFQNVNQGDDKARIDPQIRSQLREHFKPFNERLYQWVGRDFEWQ